MPELEFRISSALKNIIGRDLITDDFIAVFELVKNSYDAYANKVTIAFEEDKITIADNGKGMSLDDLKDKWLFVAYSAKHEGVEDEDIKNLRDYRDKIKAKRYYAGAKGIGRFSCDRLGQNLKLLTRKIKTNPIEQLEVDWGKFDVNAEQEFIEIKVDQTTLSETDYKTLSHGTILEITNLSSSWTRDRIKELKQSLGKLINPFGSFNGNEKDDYFAIEIIYEKEIEEDKKEPVERKRVNGFVQNFIFETLDIKTTQIITEINKDSIITELIDRNNPIYKIKEPNKDFKLLEDVKFHLFFLNRKAKHNFSLQMGLQPKQFGTIFLFKNGFRVYPFGEEDDDSLGLDLRKTQGYARFLGTRDLIGRIEIFSNSDEFREKSSRDGGLEKTQGYKQLVDAFYEKCLKRLEKYVVEIQWAYYFDENLRDDKDRDDISLLETIGTKNRIASLIENLADRNDVEILSYNKDFVNIINEKVEELIPEAFGTLAKLAERTSDVKFQEKILEAENKYKKLLKEKADAELRAREAEESQAEAEERERQATEQLETEKQKNTYLLATRRTLSEDSEGLVHSIKINTIKINKSIGNLIRKISTEEVSEKTIIQELINIRFYSDRAYKISTLITRANFKSTIDKQTIDLSKYIAQYLSLYSDIYDKADLDFEIVDNNSSFTKKISVLELSIVIDNLISNAEKWNANKIQVQLDTDESGNLNVLFSDNGDGVVKKHLTNPEQIFEVGVTETDGSGIGLYSSRKILKTMGAEIFFLGNNEKLKGATFQIIFHK